MKYLKLFEQYNLAPNGKKSNLSTELYHLVRTPQFKEWFGDWENDPQNSSKIKDEYGEPLVAYHSSNTTFDIFKPSNTFNGFFFTDDWGTEKALLIPPELWRQFFKPRYMRIFEAVHKAGWHVWMHTCGKVNEVIEDLIEIGLDVINLLRPRLLGIEEIGQRFRGRICFESLCDLQRTLPFKGPEEIRDEAKLLLKNWATNKGGFILTCYNGEEIGATPEKEKLMLEAFQEFDPWKR